MSDEKAKIYFEKGIKFNKEKKIDLARQSFEEALKYSPNRPSILKNLAVIHFYKKNYEKVDEILKKLENQNIDDKELDELRFKVLKNLNKSNQLKQFLDKKVNLTKSNNFYYIYHKLMYPDFFNSQEEINVHRDQINKDLDEILNLSNTELNLDRDILEPPIFNLSYDQFDNLEINKKIVKVFRKIYPLLNSFLVTEKKNQKIKIGFFSEFFSNHTIGKLFKGLIFKLDRSIFDITVFHSKKTKKTLIFNEFLESEIKLGTKNIILDKNFSDKISTIRKENLDIVFFPEIGMSTEFYYLSFLRIAKIQITSWGHPITSANESIDYFLSSDLLKGNNEKEIFSEKMIYLKHLPMYFYKPKIQKTLSDNEIVNQRVYFCSQTLIKFHPHFDEILKKILLEDKHAKIYLIDDNVLGSKLRNRLKKNISINYDNINFLNKLSIDDYINKCGEVSVLLDTLYFGAGNSFHESMYYGTPTVTLPTQNLKSKIVTGAYKQMQIDDPPISENTDDYVKRAIELANLDSKKMLDLKYYYKKRANDLLYENEHFIEEMNTLFIDLFNKK